METSKIWNVQIWIPFYMKHVIETNVALLNEKIFVTWWWSQKVKYTLYSCHQGTTFYHFVKCLPGINISLQVYYNSF